MPLRPRSKPGSPIDSSAAGSARKALIGSMNDYGRYAGLGFQFAASMGVMGFGGYWLDGRLGTGPWLLIVGIFLGAAGGFYALLKAVPSATTSSQPPASRTPHEEDSDTP